MTPASAVNQSHRSPVETRPKTLTLDGNEQTETSPKILAATNDISFDIRSTDTPVTFPASGRAPTATAMTTATTVATTTATQSPSRPLPSPPHTLQSENSTTVEPRYSALDFRSTNSQGDDDRDYCIPNCRRHSVHNDGIYAICVYMYIGLRIIYCITIQQSFSITIPAILYTRCRCIQRSIRQSRLSLAGFVSKLRNVIK